MQLLFPNADRKSCHSNGMVRGRQENPQNMVQSPISNHQQRCKLCTWNEFSSSSMQGYPCIHKSMAVSRFDSIRQVCKHIKSKFPTMEYIWIFFSPKSKQQPHQKFPIYFLGLRGPRALSFGFLHVRHPLEAQRHLEQPKNCSPDCWSLQPLSTFMALDFDWVLPRFGTSSTGFGFLETLRVFWGFFSSISLASSSSPSVAVFFGRPGLPPLAVRSFVRKAACSAGDTTLGSLDAFSSRGWKTETNRSQIKPEKTLNNNKALCWKFFPTTREPHMGLTWLKLWDILRHSCILILFNKSSIPKKRLLKSLKGLGKRLGAGFLIKVWAVWAVDDEDFPFPCTICATQEWLGIHLAWPTLELENKSH